MTRYQKHNILNSDPVEIVPGFAESVLYIQIINLRQTTPKRVYYNILFQYFRAGITRNY
jgi:hypothetical protein